MTTPTKRELPAAAVLIAPRGMLGRAMLGALRERGVAVHGLGRPEIDLTRPETIGSAVPAGARMVVNCSAYTDVDGAEAKEETATMVNGTGVGLLAERCREVGAILVHYSTDYVFDGKGRAPYEVDHPRQPLNAYGRSKALGEEMIERSRADALVIRTSWLYAPWSKNFVRTMAGLSKERGELKVVNDQRGRPTSAERLASASLDLLEAGARGMYHVTDGGECTWFELARHVASRVSPSCRVVPCTSDQFPRPAPRPAYSVLSLARTEALIGPMSAWEERVDDVLLRLEA